jgi:hypothetical protein
MFVLLILSSTIIIALVVFVVLYLRFKNDHDKLVHNIACLTTRHLRREKA